ncbi:MAG: hypothetical protein HRT99_03825 [Mycoplasmatales bacterium]|nr:hypothetical protein [Mycoplasmatales bacterium]
MKKKEKNNFANDDDKKIILKDEPEKSSYYDNTIVFNAYGTEKSKTSKNSFWHFSKIWKMLTLLSLFALIVFSVYSYSVISEKTITGVTLGKNYSELIAIPLLAILNTAFLSLLIKNSSKTFYTIWQKKFTLFEYLFNILLGFITPILMLTFDISSDQKWTMLFLTFAIIEIARIILIYLTLLIKSYVTKNLFPIELLKTKWSALSLFNILPFVFLYMYVNMLRNQKNNEMITIMLALIIVTGVIGALLTFVSFILSSKLDNQAGSFLEEEEKQVTTLMGYILTIVVAPFIGVSISNFKANHFDYSIIIGGLISLVMILLFSFFTIKNYKKPDEEKRAPLKNSIILDGYLFVNVMLLSSIHMLSATETGSSNYSFLLLYGIYSLIILSINIIFEAESFKYLFKSKMFIIFGSFILALVNVFVISSLINSQIILSLYNGELTTILFVCQVLPMSLILMVDLILMLKWTRNTNQLRENQKQKEIYEENLKLKENYEN